MVVFLRKQLSQQQNTSVAEVDKEGSLSAQGLGKTTIIGKYGTAVCKWNIKVQLYRDGRYVFLPEISENGFAIESKYIDTSWDDEDETSGYTHNTAYFNNAYFKGNYLYVTGGLVCMTDDLETKVIGGYDFIEHKIPIANKCFIGSVPHEYGDVYHKMTREEFSNNYWGDELHSFSIEIKNGKIVSVEYETDY